MTGNDARRQKILAQYKGGLFEKCPIYADRSCSDCSRFPCNSFEYYALNKLLDEAEEREAKLQSDHAAFRKEWAERFGFLQSKYPPDSIESIDEVASIINRIRDDSEEVIFLRTAKLVRLP